MTRPVLNCSEAVTVKFIVQLNAVVDVVSLGITCLRGAQAFPREFAKKVGTKAKQISFSLAVTFAQ